MQGAVQRVGTMMRRIGPQFVKPSGPPTRSFFNNFTRRLLSRNRNTNTKKNISGKNAANKFSSLATAKVINPEFIKSMTSRKPKSSNWVSTVSQVLKNPLPDPPPERSLPAYLYTTTIRQGLYHIPLILQKTIFLGFVLNPAEYVIYLRALQKPMNSMYLASIYIPFKNLLEGVYGDYTKNFHRIPQNIVSHYRKQKPDAEISYEGEVEFTNEKKTNKIKAQIDHIVPRQEVALKLLMMVTSKVNVDIEEMKGMNINTFNDYIEQKVGEKLPKKEEIHIINSAYNAAENFRLIEEASHKVLTKMETHKINPDTFKAETMIERLRENGKIPRQLTGYIEKENTNIGITHTYESVINFSVDTNNSICDSLSEKHRGNVFINDFAENMKQFFKERAGIQRGGSRAIINEYGIYNLLVYTLGNKIDQQNNKQENDTLDTIESQVRLLSNMITKFMITFSFAVRNIVDRELGKI